MLTCAEPFIRAVTDFVFAVDAPERVDVIFIPGSRRVEHAVKAAEMYHAGYAPLIVPSGRFTVTRGYFAPLPERLRAEYPDEYATESHFLSAVLQRHGVPESAILREESATYTWENAQFSRDLLKSHGIAVKTAMLCCRSFHARRALLYYQAAMPDVRFIVCPASAPGCSRDDWFLTEKGRARVMGEVHRLGSQVSEVFEAMLKEESNSL